VARGVDGDLEGEVVVAPGHHVVDDHVAILLEDLGLGRLPRSAGLIVVVRGLVSLDGGRRREQQEQQQWEESRGGECRPDAVSSGLSWLVHGERARARYR